MTQFKGTKGKWILRENLSTVMSDENCMVARVFDGKGNSLLANKEQSDEIVFANAQLISKAPEMLEMLNELLKELSFHGHNNSTAIYKAKQLIEQATKID